MAEFKCDSPSSEKCIRLKQLTSSAKRLKTSELSSENLKLGENPGYGETVQGKTKRKRDKGQVKTKCIGKEADDISSNLEFPSHSQDELIKIYGERTQRKAMSTFDSKELESSEEEEGISEEKLEETEGWKLLMAALDSKFEKKHQANLS